MIELSSRSLARGTDTPGAVSVKRSQWRRCLDYERNHLILADFLEHRAGTIANLLQAGLAVCLPDLRGTGETRPGGGRGRRSPATRISSTELMLGQTLLGSRLKDLRSLLAVLRKRPDIDANRMVLWGDSFAETNPRDRRLAVPLGVDERPYQSEPLGHPLALPGGLFDEEVAAVVSARGGLIGWRTVMNRLFLYLPHDVVVPGALTAGDLADVAAALAPRPVWIADLVDGQNRAAGMSEIRQSYAPARRAYRAVQAQDRLVLRPRPIARDRLVTWLRAQPESQSPTELPL